MKKILFIATIPSFLNAFMVNNFKILHELGYEIHAAVGSVHDLEDKIPSYVKMHYLSIQRSPFSSKNIKAYKELVQLINSNNIEIIDCHTPVGGALGRLVAHKTRKFCIYTAHGFHFCKGASLLNWIVYYPIEKWLSRFTDILITINKEDYNRAKENFFMKHLEYIPGVGVDINKFQIKNFNREMYRKNLGIKEDDFAILSVGELNKNKNQEIIIRAIAKLKNKKIHYFIAGVGNLESYLRKLSDELKVSNQVHLLGFRNDIVELNHSVDIFAFPTKREGLGLAAIEAMASGLPLLTSNTRGINDYSKNKVTGFKYQFNDIDGFADGICQLMYDVPQRTIMKNNNRIIAQQYSINIVKEIMLHVYENLKY